jgi:tetratricopeptide (TPR) repeat protein
VARVEEEARGVADPLDSVEQRLADALALAQRAEWSQALAAVERAIEAAPETPEPYLAKGRILRAADGDQGVILRAFRKAVECGAPAQRRAESLREYALALEPIGRHREAAAALEEAIELVASLTPPGGTPRAPRQPSPERDATRRALEDLYDLASRAHEKAGDFERALDRHRRAERFYREERRDIAAFYAREADLLERLERYGDLVRCYARLVDADPDRALFAQPDVARPTTAQIERHKRLIHGINAFLAEHPDDIVAQGFKAGFFFRLGRYRNAEHLLVRAIESAPHHFYAYHLLGKVRLKTGRAAAALEALEKARPLAPDYFDLARDRALALELCGKDAEALEAYRRIETRWPGGGMPGIFGRRELLLRAARLREKLGLVEEAYDSYRQASALVLPADRDILRKLAGLALALGRPKDALRHLDEALDTAPALSREGAAELRLFRAEVREAAGDAAGALAELETVIAESKDAKDGAYRAAVARKAALLIRPLGRADEALACAEQLLALDGEDEGALLLKGDALKAARRFAESVECYSRAADRKLAAALIDEGAKLFEAARFDKAISKYNEAFRRNPQSWEIFYYAAAAYARLAQAAPAAKYLECAAKVNRGALALMEKDRDFEAIRGTREVQDLLARCGAAADHAGEKDEPPAKGPPS